MNANLFLVLVAIAVVNVNAVETNVESKCECGVFQHPTPDTRTDTPVASKAPQLQQPTLDTRTDTPVASKAPQFDFDCNTEGKQMCLNMCKALAQASREEGPKKLCEILDTTNNPFVPAVYYRACNESAWTFSGLQPTLKVCCNNKKVITPCA